jgi:hypothetical protein
MKRGLALLLAITASAAAQEPPAKPPAPKPAAERPPLNLKLDNPSSFATIAPAEKKQPALPTLGGDARKIAPVPESREANTIPKDTNPGH